MIFFNSNNCRSNTLLTAPWPLEIRNSSPASTQAGPQFAQISMKEKITPPASPKASSEALMSPIHQLEEFPEIPATSKSAKSGSFAAATNAFLEITVIATGPAVARTLHALGRWSGFASFLGGDDLGEDHKG